LPGTTLQHTATRCNTLRHTATRCNILQHTATHCNTLQHTAAESCSSVLPGALFKSQLTAKSSSLPHLLCEELWRRHTWMSSCTTYEFPLFKSTIRRAMEVTFEKIRIDNTQITLHDEAGRALRCTSDVPQMYLKPVKQTLSSGTVPIENTGSLKV